MRSALLLSLSLLQGCAAVLAVPPVLNASCLLCCIVYDPQWECLTPEEGPINWRTPEQRQELRDAFAARLDWYSAKRAPMLGE